MRWSVRPERKRESEVEREKIYIYIYIKCTCYSNRAYMHDYYSNCAFMYNFTPTDVCVFLLKMCKIGYFFHFA